MADHFNPRPRYPAFKPGSGSVRPLMDCPRCGCPRDVVTDSETPAGVQSIALDCEHTFRVDLRGPFGPVVSWDETYVMRPGDTPSVPLRNA